MNVLVTSSPALGQMWDVVPIAWAIRSRGHDVRVATLPNLIPHVIQTSLTALPAGPHADPATLPVADPDGPGGRLTSARQAGRMSRLLATGLAGPLAAFRPDLVVHEAMELGGPLIAQRLGIPCVQQNSGLPMPPQLRQLLGQAAADLRRDFGMSGHVQPPSLVIDVCPAGLAAGAAQARHQSMRYVPFHGPAEVPQWLYERPRRARVCIALNAAKPAAGALALASRIALALRALDAEVLLPLPAAWAADPALARSGVRTVGWVPLPLLADSCAAIVHHGDPGTTLAMLGSGVPQLVMSPSADAAALASASLLEDCGAGRGIDPTVVTDEEITACARALLGDGQYRQAAAKVAAGVAGQPSPAQVAGVIERLADGGAG
jgi:glycosyltransferase